MGFASFFKKFASIAEVVAPVVIQAIGLPPGISSAVVSGITVAQQMSGSSNDEKAVQAATITQNGIQALNAIVVAQGGKPLVDEAVSADALNTAVKMTYDITKMIHIANGDPMPVSK